MASEERLMIPTLPFANPCNRVEEGINNDAMNVYLDPKCREDRHSFNYFAMHPTKPACVYHVMAGWTLEGWRTFVNLYSGEGFAVFMQQVAGFAQTDFAPAVRKAEFMAFIRLLQVM